MTDHEVDTFVDALLNDQTPKRFPATREDRDILRIAIELRTRQTERISPEPSFVEQLHLHLASALRGGAKILPLDSSGLYRGERRPMTARLGTDPASAGRISRKFRGAAKAAAAALLVAGTFTATRLTDSHSPVPVAQSAVNAGGVRSGVLVGADGRTLGRAYAYTGDPSWVFMDVHTSGLSGLYVCRLQLADSSTILAGVLTVHNGTGDWAHTIKVPAAQLREATLVAPNGSIMARATFS
ncbi:MAG TPA: hypothetical protein VFZ97_10260 [Acidimicrobiales bacterium]